MSERIMDLARDCPREYPVKFDEWEDNESVRVLSQSLADAGYIYLSHAVLGGKAWPRRICDGESLTTLDEWASHPGWSWNKATGDE